MSGLLAILTMGSLILALKQRAPLSVYAYLLAELVYIPPVMLAAWLLGIWSPWYAAIYVLFTLPILLAILWIVHDVLLEVHADAKPVAIAFILAIIPGRMSYLEIHRPVTRFDWINLIFGVALMWAGTLVGYAAKHIERWDLGLILAILWILQAVSFFGWTIHLWEKWNFVIDPVLGIVAFSLLAWRTRDRDYSPTALVHR